MGLITDPSTGLLDNVDYILLAGATGLHERFGRIYTLVNGNLDKDNLKINSDFPWTGKHTFEAGNIKVKGAGAGIASIQNANTGTDRLITIPDPGADADFVTTKGNQTIDDTKTFSQNLAFKSGTGFNGVFDHANTADRTWTIPDIAGEILLGSAVQIVSGAKTFTSNTFLLGGAGAGIATIIYANTATNRVYTVPDSGANANFVMTEGAQTLNGTKTFGAQVGLPIVDPPTANLLNSNSIVKAWGRFNTMGVTLASYNIQSIAYQGASSIALVTFSTPFASSNYAVVISGNVANDNTIINAYSLTANNFQVSCMTPGGLVTKAAFSFIVIGLQ